MNPKGKYNLEYLQSITRHSQEWKEFVCWQHERILERIERYNRVSTAKEQLKETGDLTPYQHYKTSTVTAFLIKALERIKNGNYGICENCGNEIPVGRLLLVAPALQCVDCENKRMN